MGRGGLGNSPTLNSSKCVSVYALPAVTVVIMLIISIFIANQFRVLFILIRLIVQVVDPESTRVQDNYCGVYGTESVTTDVGKKTSL